MIKVLRVIVFSMLVILLAKINPCFAGWPINICPGMEGRVVDATTGQPVENAILQVKWVAWRWAIVDRTYPTISTKLVVTNKEGKFRIPRKVSFHIISGFDTAWITVRHPLYETKEISIRYSKTEIKTDEKTGRQYVSGAYYVYIGPIKHGRVQYDFKVMSLKEKKSLPDGQSWYYFKWAKKIGVNIDRDFIYKKWDKLLENWSEYGEYIKKLKNNCDEF
ncbi:MAG: carboxypeptidase-like regulatory domain-containing protein [Elusimicrobiota bacterium]